jgi:hypothetical protein
LRAKSCSIWDTIFIDLKNSLLAAGLKWAAVSKAIKEKYNVRNNMTKWRNALIGWYRDNNLKKLKVKGIKI